MRLNFYEGEDLPSFAFSEDSQKHISQLNTSENSPEERHKRNLKGKSRFFDQISRDDLLAEVRQTKGYQREDQLSGEVSEQEIEKAVNIKLISNDRSVDQALKVLKVWRRYIKQSPTAEEHFLRMERLIEAYLSKNLSFFDTFSQASFYYA